MTDLSHDLRISREALAAAEQRATAAEEKLKSELRAVGQVLGEHVSLGRQVAALEQKRAEAEWACAAMRAALMNFAFRITVPGGPCFCQSLATHFGDPICVAARAALSTPIGSGWLSPEQGAEKVKAEREHIKRLILGGSFLHEESAEARFAREVVSAIDRDTEKRALAAPPTEEAPR